ncbi:MAG: aldolase catalytic domain-containing protein [Lachnospiraceae bacterium]|nr:aldolase catalytic domain-containing protein [Lachnospiraceae bacterium]
MKRVNVLDCTLRDGGYCNNWMFGLDNARRIVAGLIGANVEFIECGFLTNRVDYDPERTKFTSMEQLSRIIPDGKVGKPCLVMVNYGEYEAADLPECSETAVDGIRVAFHKKDMTNALKLCEEIVKKGYMVFVQPMVSMSYSEEEFLTLIRETNKIRPFAFYIVDSFGMMKKNALMKLVELIEKNLSEEIVLGFHAHNNLQLAYSNAQYLAELPLKRPMVIDVSVHGMGRGAGNLNAELFLDYLNETIGASYSIRPILSLMDEVVSHFYEEKSWGYSLPNYLSATHMVHPNYATYLDHKNTLTLEAMDEIFDMMDKERGVEYDAQYVEQLYIDYLSSRDHKASSINELKSKVQGRKALLVSPGRSVVGRKDKLRDFAAKENAVIFSINHDDPYLDADYIFVSNMRRFRNLPETVYKKTIITSNIRCNDTYACVDYFRLLNVVEGVRDNAGLMAMKFLMQLGVEEFYLAGFDGYSHDAEENFESRDMALLKSTEVFDQINAGMKQCLELFSKDCRIRFLTESYVIPDSADLIDLA